MMRVLAFEGQRGAAIAQYETCRRVLAEELGIEPSSETRELYEQIRTGRWKLDVGNQRLDTPRVAGFQHPTSNIQLPVSNVQFPTHSTPFIGRERELADLRRLIADPDCRCI